MGMPKKTRSLQKPVGGYRECILGTEVSKKIETTETEVLVNIELARLDRQSVEERLHSADTRTS